MTVIVGEGDHRYRAVEDWAKLPDGWEFRDVGAVAYTNWPSSHGDEPLPGYLRTLQKFEKIV